MEEIEYKHWLIRRMEDILENLRDEMTSAKESFLHKYSNKYTLRIQKFRNHSLVVIGFIATILGIMQNFNEDVQILISKSDVLFYLLITDLIIGVAMFVVCSLWRDKLSLKLHEIEGAYISAETKLDLTKGIVATSTLYIQDISLYDLFLLSKSVHLVGASHLEIFCAIYEASTSKLFYKDK